MSDFFTGLLLVFGIVLGFALLVAAVMAVLMVCLYIGVIVKERWKEWYGRRA